MGTAGASRDGAEVEGELPPAGLHPSGPCGSFDSLGGGNEVHEKFGKVMPHSQTRAFIMPLTLQLKSSRVKRRP